MYNNFDELLASIHNGNEQIPVVSDTEESIIIDAEKRIFIIPQRLNTKIGITSDCNSNELTFKCPTSIEGHDITKCSHAVVKWYNTTSLMLGSTELLRSTVETIDNREYITMKWIVPSEALSKAGPLQVALCFCDIVKDDAGNDIIIYKWNSEICTAFSVAQGLDNVSIAGVPLSRIVTIDMYNRTLSLPSSFNTTIANVGDSGIGKITFRINRFYDNIDFATAGLMIRWTNATQENGESYLDSSKIIESLSGNEHDDWMEFEWNLPFKLVESSGSIKIITTLVVPAEGKDKVYVWNSNPFKDFKIGEGSLPDFEVEDSSEFGLTIVPKEAFSNLLFKEYGYVYTEGGNQ